MATKSALDRLKSNAKIEALWEGCTTPDDDDALEKSILERGVLNPLLVDEDHRIIDGLRRLRVCINHNIRQVFVTVVKGLSEREKLHLAVEVNAKRRHLSMEQRKKLVATLLKDNPRLAANYLARLCNVSDKTAQAVKDALVAGSEIPKVKEVLGRDGKVYRPRRVTGFTAPIKDLKQGTEVLGDVRELPGIVTPKKVRTQARKERFQKAQAAGAKVKLRPGDINLFHCDFRKLQVKPKSVGMVLTDPPYEKDFTDAGGWKDLAAFSKRVLKPGGYLAAYAGTNDLPRVLADLATQLTYVWTVCVPFGKVCAGYNHFGDLLILNKWRPVLIFYNGKPPKARSPKEGEYRHRLIDLRSWTTGPEKDFHPHQQGLAEIWYLLRVLSEPGDLICDPFLGGGTSAVACVKEGRRRFVGCDIEEKWVNSTKHRLDLLARGEGPDVDKPMPLDPDDP